MSVTITREGTELRAHIVLEEEPDVSYLLQGDINDPDPDERAGARAWAIRNAAYNRGDWWMTGVYVTLHDADGNELARSAGLWNVESDSGDYFAEIIREETYELASALGVDLSSLDDPEIVEDARS